MPQLGNLILTDRKAAPVAHTFVPGKISNTGIGEVKESTGVPIGDNTVTLGLKSSSSRRKPELRFYFPVVQNQTINGVTSPVVVRYARARIEFDFDVTSSEDERKDVVGMVQSSLDAAKVLTNDLCVKVQDVY